MLNPRNYVRLLPEEAIKELEEQKRLLKEAYEECSDLIPYHAQYFDRSFEKIEFEGNRIPLFYGPWKVHKDEDSNRPVVSSCGSFPEIFSIFVDEMLKRLVQDVLKSYIISADQLVYKLTKKFSDHLPKERSYLALTPSE